MNRKRLSSPYNWLLLLILAVGPVRAQTVFVCEMMDSVVHGDCCCVGQKNDDECDETGCAGAAVDASDPCCKRSAQITLDEEARQDAPIVKSVEVRSGVDPPDALAAAIHDFLPSRLLAVKHNDRHLPFAGHPRTDLYLTTLRLRI